MVPPMRPRAGTTLMLSTVANTAFSSATGRAATVSVSARTSAVPQCQRRDKAQSLSIHASFVLAISLNCRHAAAKSASHVDDVCRAALTCLNAPPLAPA